MDSANTGVVLGGIGVAVSVLTTIVGIVNHKRIRSNCCGKKLEASLDIEGTTPPTVAPAPPPIKVEV